MVLLLIGYHRHQLVKAKSLECRANTKKNETLEYRLCESVTMLTTLLSALAVRWRERLMRRNENSSHNWVSYAPTHKWYTYPTLYQQSIGLWQMRTSFSWRLVYFPLPNKMLERIIYEQRSAAKSHQTTFLQNKRTVKAWLVWSDSRIDSSRR